MAELEVKKHLKKIIGVIKLPNNGGWLKKLGAIAVEVAIIVFSLVLANALHNYSLRKHQEEECKIFLQGLKEDLKADISTLKENILFYKEADSSYRYLNNLPSISELNKGRLNYSLSGISTSCSFRPHSSRYEGFKSSGKLLQIEDQKLLYNILLLYQEKIQNLGLSENAWLSSHNRLMNYLMEETDIDINNIETAVAHKIFNQRKVKNYTSVLIPWDQLLERYQEVLTLEQTIIKQINQHYPENDK